MNLTIEQRHLRSIRGSFSLWDALAIIIVIGLLGAWFAFAHSGEGSRIVRCSRNLAALGESVHSYANDHDGGLPAAGISFDQTRIGWYEDLVPYLKSGSAKAKSAYDKKQLLAGLQSSFLCPSDSIQRRNPCSYAMAGRLMTYGWPPGPDDKTSVGLWWDQRTVPALLGDNVTAEAVAKNRELLPRLKQSVLTDPADTLVLTEFITRNNTLGFLSCTRVFGVDEQLAPFTNDLTEIHFGRFNYLMADGHVELLTKLQTGGIGKEPAGIWTIKAGD